MPLRRQPKSPTLKPAEYPSGVFLKTEKGYFYTFSPTQRYRILTSRVLDSWAPQRIIDCSELDPAVRKCKVFSKLKFRNGSLLYSQASGKMYLVSDFKLRHITNPDALIQLGATRKDAVWVSEAEINLHEMGEPLNG